LVELHPDGQQLSSAPHTVIVVCVQCAEQLSAVPIRASTVHALPSSHEVGQAPGCPAGIPLSQDSPFSTRPLPQLAGQSLSLTAVQPPGQQPSPAAQVVMRTWLQVAVQSAALPVTLSVVHGSVSAQSVGQAPSSPAAMAGSQLSPGSSRPLPQPGSASDPPSRFSSRIGASIAGPPFPW
jgi:hypothetical protein